MFGKKKKNEQPSPPPEIPPVEENTKGKKGKGVNKKGETKDLVPVVEVLPQTVEKKKFKFLPKKLLSKKVLFLLLTLISVGIAAFVVYKIYFTKKDAGVVERIYVQQELSNVILAEEVIRFSFDFLPEFYEATVLFNSEIILLENEVKRLTALGEKFPDQIKIAEKEIKLIEKEKSKLKQTYDKLEKRVEALYVSYQVNQESGFQQIKEQKNDISTGAKEALSPVLELTKRIRMIAEAAPKAPEGFIKGNIYKIRKQIEKLIGR
ncbi:MAG: hypothetical protein HQK73_07835 [Desulfamplus sp.]|nr:hypothetical protein [Desulfamplus sp.]